MKNIKKKIHLSLLASTLLLIPSTACRTTSRTLDQSILSTSNLSTASHTRSATLRIDSLFSSLTLSADSISILIPADSASTPRAIRLTAHNPRLHSDSQSASTTVTASVAADTLTVSTTRRQTSATRQTSAPAHPFNLPIPILLLIPIVILLLLLSLRTPKRS